MYLPVPHVIGMPSLMVDPNWAATRLLEMIWRKTDNCMVTGFLSRLVMSRLCEKWGV